MARTTTRYRVEARKTIDGWAGTVPGVPGAFSEARRLDQIPGLAAEALSTVLDADVTAEQIDVAPTR